MDRIKRILAMVCLTAALCPAAKAAPDIRQRALEFRAAVKGSGPVKDAPELKAALATAQGMYDQRLPEDYGNALRLQSRANWNEMTAWYKLASQELMWLGKEAKRLAAACRGLGGGAGDAGEAAGRTAASAKGFLSFIDRSAWGEGLSKPMLGEVRTAQAAAVKDWERVALCAGRK